MKINLLLKQQIKINTLENELNTLKKQLKNGLYEDYIRYANGVDAVEELKKENKRLRLKIKELKETLNEKK